MKLPTRFIVSCAVAILLACPLAILAQWDKKPYTEWSDKETRKLLDESPWSQKQTFTDTSKTASTRSTTGDPNPSSPSAASTATRGQTTTTIADTIHVTFRMRFFTAKPVRQAISRSIELQQKSELPEALATRLKALATGDFPDLVIITVTCESDRASNLLQQAQALLQQLKTADLKNNTYLLTKDGRRVFLQEYQSPRNDGFGARFVFPRVVDGKPLLTPDSGEVLFHAELKGGSMLNGTIANSDVTNNGFTLSMRYKVKDMVFGGKLEY